MSGKILNCTQEEYFADPCKVPSLDPTTAHILLSQSPRHAFYAHPRLGGEKREPSRFMDSGSLVHALLLDKGKNCDVIPFDSFRKKEAQELRDAAHEAGRIPVLAEEMDRAQSICEDLRNDMKDNGIILEGGQAEMMIQWTEEADNGHPVQCKGMLDYWQPDTATIYDLKCVTFGRPEACQANSIKRSDVIQVNAYMSAIASLHPELMGRLNFVFLFAECLGASGTLKKTRPYCVSPLQPDGMLRGMSEMKWQQAINRWEECLRLKRWPGYASDGIISMTAPLWAVKQAMEEGYETDFEEV